MQRARLTWMALREKCPRSAYMAAQDAMPHPETCTLSAHRGAHLEGAKDPSKKKQKSTLPIAPQDTKNWAVLQRDLALVPSVPVMHRKMPDSCCHPMLGLLAKKV
jgi:hypothetical protein